MEVVNIKLHNGEGVTYIGRGSVLGNPFVIGQHGTREEVIERFRAYARTTPSIRAAIKALPEDAVLGCFCAPEPCHGHAIRELWQEMNAEPDAAPLVVMQITAPNFTAAVRLDPETKNVVSAAPILHYMHGWHGNDVWKYAKEKGWTPAII